MTADMETYRAHRGRESPLCLHVGERIIGDEEAVGWA
jgi:hypothetical protein